MPSIIDLFYSVLSRITPGGSLRTQTVRSGFWVTIKNILERIFQLVQVVVLANLLTPSDFGLMGIALLSVAIFRRISQIGINESLIQQKGENVDEYLNTAWVLHITRGVLISLVLFFAAPHISSFFGEPRATEILRVTAIGPLLTGLKNPGIIYLIKDLDFHKQTILTLSGSFFGMISAIGYAILYQSVWALVIGYLVSDLARLFVSYFVHDYRPKLKFRVAYCMEIINYGKWITVSSIMILLITQGDDIFVGWFLTASALGYYQVAYRIKRPINEVTTIIRQVVFPAYSKMQADEGQLRETYLKTIQLSSFLSTPAAIGVIAVAPTFTQGILGPQWLPIVLPMQILALVGLFRSADIASPLFRAIGRPDLETKLMVPPLFIIFASIYPFTETYGISGTALSILLGYGTSFLIRNTLIIWRFEISTLRFVKLLFYPFVGSVIMGLIVTGVDRSYDLPQVDMFGLELRAAAIELIFLVILGFIVYLVNMLLIQRYSSYDINAQISSILNSFT